MKKRLLSIALIFTLLAALCVVPAQAKTIESAKADNIFFYATNAEGKSVLLKVMPLSEVKQLAHGQTGGENYYIHHRQLPDDPILRGAGLYRDGTA